MNLVGMTLSEANFTYVQMRQKQSNAKVTASNDSKIDIAFTCNSDSRFDQIKEM